MKTFRDDLQKQKERVLDAPNDHSQKSERQRREFSAYSCGVASLPDAEQDKELDSLPPETREAVIEESASHLNEARAKERASYESAIERKHGDSKYTTYKGHLRNDYKRRSLLIERDYERYKIDEQGQDQQDHANPDEVTEPEVAPDYLNRVEDGRQWNGDKGKSKDDKDKDQGLEL